MFRGLRNEFEGVLGELRHGTRIRTLTIAKPYCSPSRPLITATFQQYGVKLYGFEERTVKRSAHDVLGQLELVGKWDNGDIPSALPLYEEAKVTVSEKQAAWAEYLLLRTGKLYCPEGFVNKRNKDWAARHGGQMPPAWKDGRPWIEKSCSDGMAAWKPIRGAMKAQKKGKK